MGLDLEYDNGQTPIDEDEKTGLKIPTISTKQELDEFEQNNIEKAIQWTLKNRFKSDLIFSDQFIKRLHKKMFGEIWKWAGEYRKSNKNIGVDKTIISTQVKNLTEDSKFWLENNSFDSDEVAIRFKHRLVAIHLFPNGNGRHSRLMADIIISHIFNKPVFTWGSSTNINKPGQSRNLYIKSLREADNGNYENLIKFARS